MPVTPPRSIFETMHRTASLLLTLLLALPLAALPKPRAIVLFLTDDLGYNDTSAYGCEKVPCPNLDRLADEGLVFRDAHSTASVCTPSRFSLLTGKYAWRQKGTGILPGDAKLILPTTDEAMSLPALMQKAGYRTAAVGKWHLGLGRGKAPIDWNAPISPGPREVGFDESFIMAATGDRVPCVYLKNGRVVNLDPADPIRVSYTKTANNAPLYEEEITATSHPHLLKPWGHPSDHQHSDTLHDGISRIGHMTGGQRARWKDQDLADTLTEEACRIIRETAGKPLFLYFATNDIHVPRDPHARFRGKSQLGIRGDVTVQMDDALGRLRTALRDAGYADEECLIIFTSDNGPVISDGYEDGARRDCAGHDPAAPYSGGKYGLREGGTRLPFIVHWPRQVQPGKSNALMSQADLGRTLATLVGVENDIPAGDLPDSESHLPALLGQAGAGGRHELVTQNGSASLALRSGNYKYIPGRKPQLYDLSQDIQEKHNIADQNPELVKQLEARLQAIRRGH